MLSSLEIYRYNHVHDLCSADWLLYWLRNWQQYWLHISGGINISCKTAPSALFGRICSHYLLNNSKLRGNCHNGFVYLTHLCIINKHFFWPFTILSIKNFIIMRWSDVRVAFLPLPWTLFIKLFLSQNFWSLFFRSLVKSLPKQLAIAMPLKLFGSFFSSNLWIGCNISFFHRVG